MKPTGEVIVMILILLPYRCNYIVICDVATKYAEQNSPSTPCIYYVTSFRHPSHRILRPLVDH